MGRQRQQFGYSDSSASRSHSIIIRLCNIQKYRFVPFRRSMLSLLEWELFCQQNGGEIEYFLAKYSFRTNPSPQPKSGTRFFVRRCALNSIVIARGIHYRQGFQDVIVYYTTRIGNTKRPQLLSRNLTFLKLTSRQKISSSWMDAHVSQKILVAMPGLTFFGDRTSFYAWQNVQYRYKYCA